MDAGTMLLGMIALSWFPVAFPQLTRLMTGQSAEDEEFIRKHRVFLERVAVAFKGNGHKARRKRTANETIEKSRGFLPKGELTIAQRFSVGLKRAKSPSPEGTAEPGRFRASTQCGGQATNGKPPEGWHICRTRDTSISLFVFRPRPFRRFVARDFPDRPTEWAGRKTKGRESCRHFYKYVTPPVFQVPSARFAVHPSGPRIRSPFRLFRKGFGGR